MNEILEFVEREDLGKYVTCWQDEPFKLPFEILPQDFISFAEEDLKANDRRSLVNALGNIKRSIDCRLDSLIYLFGLYKKAKKENWSFPKKLKYLESLHIITPRILTKINTKRNKLEHEFKFPTLDEVEDALDVANLFILYTEKFLNKTFDDFEWSLINGDEGWPWIRISLNSEEGEFNLRLIKSKDDIKEATITSDSEPEYIRVLKQCVNCLKER